MCLRDVNVMTVRKRGYRAGVLVCESSVCRLEVAVSFVSSVYGATDSERRKEGVRK